MDLHLAFVYVLAPQKKNKFSLLYPDFVFLHNALLSCLRWVPLQTFPLFHLPSHIIFGVHFSFPYIVFLIGLCSWNSMSIFSQKCQFIQNNTNTLLYTYTISGNNCVLTFNSILTMQCWDLSSFHYIQYTCLPYQPTTPPKHSFLFTVGKSD